MFEPMEDLQNGAVEETQRNDLQRDGEEEAIDPVKDVKPEVDVSTEEKDLSFDDNGSTREEESDENGPRIENLDEAKEVSELVFEAVEPVPSLSEAVASMEAEESSFPVDLPETGSVRPSLEVVCEEFHESTLSNADENSETAPAERDVSLKGTDKINGQDLDGKTQENAENSELVANENVPEVEASNGNHAAAEMPKTTPVLSVTKRTSFLGCCGFFEVLRRSDR